MKIPDPFRKYSVVGYAVFLIAAVTAVIFWNSYSILNRFEKTTDELLLSKAGLAEDVFGVLSSGYLDTPETLQRKVTELAVREPDLSAIVVYERAFPEDGFRAVASTDSEDIGTVRSEFPYMLAWEEDDGSAFVSNEEGDRFWNIIRRVDHEGERRGLVFFRFSLAENDAFVRSAISRSYGVTLFSLLLVLLLLAHHLRFSRYAIRAIELEEVNRMKDDFISMASHELRSPMTVIRGYADLLSDDPTPEERKEYVDNIASTAERLSSLVDDLLNVSRIEQGRLPIDPVPVDLDGILGPLAEDYSVTAREKGLAFEYVPVTVPKAFADPERVKQIVVNLLSNAVKYTAEGSVRLSVEEDHRYLIVTVADTGFGISSEEARKLFTKFHRVRTERTANIQGTGLGLWIAREIARRMGGELGVESIEGVGSHFRLYLRKAES